MAVSNRHILEQGPTIFALGRVAYSAIEQQLNKGEPIVAPAVPGPTIEASYAPRSPDLVRDYVRHVGGDPSAYKSTLPPHLFPQWGFGLGGQALRGLPYPLAKVLNGGCTMQIRGPLPANEPLHVSARLESIDDDGRRAVLQQRVITSTPSSPEALIADMFAIVPLSQKKAENGKNGNGKNGHEKSEAEAKTKGKRDEKAEGKKETPRVPEDAREISYFKVGPKAGLDFAKLTGDFNPVHWIPGYARAFGFPNVILHGFSTMARAIEGINRSLFAGDVTRIHKWTCRFTKPLVLPARAGIYVRGNEVFVGVAVGGPAFLVGTFEV
jgi:acyl dehydratase